MRILHLPGPFRLKRSCSCLSGQPVQVIDTGYAIHLQSEGVNKGTALVALARDMGLSPKDFLAIGDGINDAQMLERAGRGVTVANAHPAQKQRHQM